MPVGSEVNAKFFSFGYNTRTARHTSELVDMSMTTRSITSILTSLIEICKDGEEGFRSAAESVKRIDLKELFSQLSIQRQQFAGELQHLVLGFGEEVEATSSFGGALRRIWMDLKAAITGGDEHTILVECERGEDAAVAEYCHALDQDELPPGVRHVIQQQYMSVQAAHDRVRDLRDRFQS